MEIKHRAAGVVVYTYQNDEIHYLLVQSLKFGHYGFPKGHVDGNETDEETALREVYEETGLEVTVSEHFKAQTSYKLPSGDFKEVVYFLGHVMDPKIKIQEVEISDYKLLPFDEALETITYEHDKNILRLANQHLQFNV